MLFAGKLNLLHLVLFGERVHHDPLQRPHLRDSLSRGCKPKGIPAGPGLGLQFAQF